ncbi:MAG TPA: haloacid dehalogenase-like hydrolase [Verrucomicrobiae bacterium]|nr:haloacid dehalogenase-like hydrolase [Verrucomicrobiae bacterium]
MTPRAISPERIGAFFDIDGTILPGASLEWRFVVYLLAHDDIGMPQIGLWLAHAARHLFHGPGAAILENKSYLRNLPESLVEMWQRSLASGGGDSESRRRLALWPFAEAIEQLKWHAAQRHRIFLLSGTLAPLARLLARQISERVHAAIEVCATELDSHCGAWTGQLAGPHISGAQKAAAIVRLAARNGLSLADSFSYANLLSDLSGLEICGHPVAVNPSRGLARCARRRGWPVVQWRGTNVVPSRVVAPPIHFEEAR